MFDMRGKETISCRLCGREAEVKFRGHPGYREPGTYDIIHCGSCGVAFAVPLECDSAVYESIYRNLDCTPGYSRYAEYADKVLSEDDPLGFLEDVEDAYWAVGRYLGGVPVSSRILEVGCGRGYLTYGISRRGYSITGLDISRAAVEEAVRRYGDRYVCTDILNYSEQYAGSFDAVIMTEVIEHVPDPAGFLTAAVRLLRNGGDVVVTTPNRSVFHRSVLWQTENPPVHLWWFSEESLRSLAGRLGLDVSFTDFSGYGSKHPFRQGCELSAGLPTRGPVLKADGSLVNEAEGREIIRGFQRNFLKKSFFKTVRPLSRLHDMTASGARRGVVCATFTKR